MTKYVLSGSNLRDDEMGLLQAFLVDYPSSFGIVSDE